MRRTSDIFARTTDTYSSACDPDTRPANADPSATHEYSRTARDKCPYADPSYPDGRTEFRLRSTGNER